MQQDSVQHQIRRELILYFLLAYALSWPVMWLIALGYLSPSFHFAGAFGPCLAALLVIVHSNKESIDRFLDGFRVSKLKGRVLLFACSPLLLFTIAVILLAVSGQATEMTSLTGGIGQSTLASSLLLILPSISYALFEEVGWRGFALPRLERLNKPLAATLKLTVFWAAWHIPMFLYRFEFSALVAVGFFISLFFGAAILTALYNFSGGSVLATMIFHLLYNLATLVNDTTVTAIFSAGIILLATGLIVMTQGRLFYGSEAARKANREIAPTANA